MPYPWNLRNWTTAGHNLSGKSLVLIWRCGHINKICKRKGILSIMWCMKHSSHRSYFQTKQHYTTQTCEILSEIPNHVHSCWTCWISSTKMIRINAHSIFPWSCCVCFASSSSARPEPQTPPCKLPYSESRPLGLGEEHGEEFRHQLAEQTKRGYYTTTQSIRTLSCRVPLLRLTAQLHHSTGAPPCTKTAADLEVPFAFKFPTQIFVFFTSEKFNFLSMTIESYCFYIYLH